MYREGRLFSSSPTVLLVHCIYMQIVHIQLRGGKQILAIYTIQVLPEQRKEPHNSNYCNFKCNTQQMGVTTFSLAEGYYHLPLPPTVDISYHTVLVRVARKKQRNIIFPVGGVMSSLSLVHMKSLSKLLQARHLQTNTKLMTQTMHVLQSTLRAYSMIWYSHKYI